MVHDLYPIAKKIRALDNWCLRRILHIYWTDFVSNDVVWSRTDQPLLSDTIRLRRLSLATFVVPTPVKTIPEFFRTAFGVLPKTDDAEPVDRGKPG